MPITLYFRTLFLCIYNRHFVKKVRIHHSCSLNPPKTSFQQARLKKTSVLRTRETLFRLIFTSGMMIRSIRLGGSNPQKCRIYGLFQPFSFVIRATHSTWHEETILIVICLVRSWELIYQSVILPKAVNGNIPTVLPVRGNVSIIHHGWQ